MPFPSVLRHALAAFGLCLACGVAPAQAAPVTAISLSFSGTAAIDYGGSITPMAISFTIPELTVAAGAAGILPDLSTSYSIAGAGLSNGNPSDVYVADIGSYFYSLYEFSDIDYRYRITARPEIEQSTYAWLDDQRVGTSLTFAASEFSVLFEDAEFYEPGTSDLAPGSYALMAPLTGDFTATVVAGEVPLPAPALLLGAALCALGLGWRPNRAA